jgi:hypothetical protein
MVVPYYHDLYKTILVWIYVEGKTPHLFISENVKWPLTGRVHSEMSLNEDRDVEGTYIAGYQDISSSDANVCLGWKG